MADESLEFRHNKLRRQLKYEVNKLPLDWRLATRSRWNRIDGYWRFLEFIRHGRSNEATNCLNPSIRTHWFFWVASSQLWEIKVMIIDSCSFFYIIVTEVVVLLDEVVSVNDFLQILKFAWLLLVKYMHSAIIEDLLVMASRVSV